MKPKRFRGQHFLVDRNMLNKIIAAAEITPADTVVEIGAGTGNLTALLAERARRVIAIEIDSDLIPVLHDRCMRYPNVEIIHDDARTFNPTTYNLQPTSYSVVANIPYNITSLIIRRLLEADPPPAKMILLIQKEVAERICAKPPAMSLLSVAVQYYVEPRILFSVPRTCFSPRPNVDSAVVSFSLYGKSGRGVPLRENGDSHRFCEDERCKQYKNGGCPHFPTAEFTAAFFHLLHAGFAHKRKLLISNIMVVIPSLSRDLRRFLAGARNDNEPVREYILAVFQSLNIPPTARAQELSVAQWEELCRALFPFSEMGK